MLTYNFISIYIPMYIISSISTATFVLFVQFSFLGLIFNSLSFLKVKVTQLGARLETK